MCLQVLFLHSSYSMFIVFESHLSDLLHVPVLPAPIACLLLFEIFWGLFCFSILIKEVLKQPGVGGSADLGLPARIYLPAWSRRLNVKSCLIQRPPACPPLPNHILAVESRPPPLDPWNYLLCSYRWTAAHRCPNTLWVLIISE